MKQTPERRLETAARYGSLRAAEALTGLKQQQQHRDFQREMNAVNFDQGMQMYDIQRNDQAARDTQQRQQQMEDWSRGEEARKQQQQENRTWDMTQHGLSVGEEALRWQREQQQQEADRGRVPQIGTVPVPGTDYVIPTADGRAMGTLPVKRPDAKPPEGLVPQGANIDGVQYGPPSTRAERPHIEMLEESPSGPKVPYSVHVDPKTGEVVMRKVKIVDANKDGIDDRTQGGGGGGAAAPKPSSFLND